MSEQEGFSGIAESIPTGSESAPSEGTSTPESAPNLIDLDQVEKFKYQGKERDLDWLKKETMRHSDYTRKSQELAKSRNEFQKEQKFYENLAIDIRNVLRNPSMVDKFKEVYPQKFHSYLEYYQDLMDGSTTPTQGQNKVAADPRLLSQIEQLKGEVGQVKGFYHAQEVAAAEAELDQVYSKMSEKYPYADQGAVTTKAMALLEQLKAQGEPVDKQKIGPRQWDMMFKTEHERVKKIAEAKYKDEVKKQQQSNRAAKDTAAGGGTPGQAPVRRTFKEATEDAIRDLKNRAMN